MLKIFVIAIFIIIVTHPVYGYTITIKEKLIGILQKTTVIRNIENFEIHQKFAEIGRFEFGIFPESPKSADLLDFPLRL